MQKVRLIYVKVVPDCVFVLLFLNACVLVHGWTQYNHHVKTWHLRLLISSLTLSPTLPPALAFYSITSDSGWISEQIGLFLPNIGNISTIEDLSLSHTHTLSLSLSLAHSLSASLPSSLCLSLTF
jgi:hypothetical protein